MTDRCTGACCEHFVITGIGRTVEEIQRYLRERNVLDGPFTADMLVPLHQALPGAPAPNGEPFAMEPPGGGWVFTCRHFDVQARACTVYAQRPHMCREFPYGRPCSHGDRCTWAAGRAGAWPPADVWYEHPPREDLGPGCADRRVHLRMMPTGNLAQLALQEVSL